jgi:hypothetical protein
MSTLEPVIAFHRNKDGKVNWRKIAITLIDPGVERKSLAVLPVILCLLFSSSSCGAWVSVRTEPGA